MSGGGGDKFARQVATYAEVHDQLQEAAAVVRDLRKRLAEMQDRLLRDMGAAGLTKVELPDGGELVRKRVEKKEALKKDHIVGELKTMASVDGDRARALVDEMYATRAVVQKETLKRLKRKA